ncbi:MAG: hypothetical protein F4Y80_09505 [Caldilineaceae bacterium SB0665_bin_21]|nr:hypothetical protein [Caldilineaceae bacterium SB0665_bin_21]MYC63350.1 hypothetical protein [Caldilineaceae bacterium SB0661_bin_34]
MTDNTPQNETTLNWSVLQTRVTAFHPDDWIAENLSDWWFTEFNQLPDRTETMPRENSTLIRGSIDIGQLRAVASPGRTDFILQPHNGAVAATDPSTPSMGTSYQPILEKSLDFAGTWLSKAMQVNRLAIGAILILPFTDLKEVYGTLSHILPVENFDGSENTPDFQYRINRVRPIDQPLATTINRLATWSVVESFRVAINPGKLEPQTNLVRGNSLQLELDINTRPEISIVFPPNSRLGVLRKLKEMAVEIAEQGDMP